MFHYKEETRITSNITLAISCGCGCWLDRNSVIILFKISWTGKNSIRNDGRIPQITSASKGYAFLILKNMQYFDATDYSSIYTDKLVIYYMWCNTSIFLGNKTIQNSIIK